MKFDSNLPIQSRIDKRRREKIRRARRIRFFTFIIITAALIFIVNTDWFGNTSIGKMISSMGIFSSDRRTVSNDETKQINESTNSGTNTAQDDENNIDAGENDKMEGNTTETEKTIQDDQQNEINVVEKKIQEMEILKNELQEYIKGFNGQYGIYYINLVDGCEFGINDTDEYIAASTVKIPINLYLYKKIENGSIKPEDTMTYLQKDYEGGTGIIQGKKVGTKFTVRELSALSIKYSDNIATNMLIRLLGRMNYKNFMRELGGTVVSDNKNISCPKDMAVYMKKVYDFYKADEKLGGQLIDDLENTVFKDRIPKLLPEDIKVAHKIGNQIGALHDVGIVFSEKPYIISVMSKNVTEAEAYDVIANISKKIYDFETKK